MDGRQRAEGRRLLLGARHPHGLRQRPPCAPHPPQRRRGGDSPRSLAVKLEERRHQAIGVHQRQMPELGVRPRQVDMHNNRVASLRRLVLMGNSVRLRLGARHFILNPLLDVAPVQRLLGVVVLVFVLQDNVLQRRHGDGGDGGGVPTVMAERPPPSERGRCEVVASPPSSWRQVIILLHSSTVHTVYFSGLCARASLQSEGK